MDSFIDMYSTEGHQNAARRHRAYVLPVTVIQVPANASHNLLTFADARNHDLRTMLAEIMAAAQLDELRYSFEGETQTAYASNAD